LSRDIIIERGGDCYILVTFLGSPEAGPRSEAYETPSVPALSHQSCESVMRDVREPDELCLECEKHPAPQQGHHHARGRIQGPENEVLELADIARPPIS